MRERVYILGSLVDKTTMEQTLETIKNFINDGKYHHIITANAEIIYRGVHEKKLSRTLNKADLVTADGSGVVWAARYLGNPVPEKVSGIDLLQEICKRAGKNGWKLYFLGAAPGVAEKAVLRILEEYPDCHIVGYEHGYFTQEEEPQIIENIKKVKPDILFVALGAPKQEYWIREHLKDLEVPVCIGVGGSFDVLAGNVERAPEWMQKRGLEWLFRLYKEPKRWRRMLALPRFVLAVIGQRARDEKEREE